MFGLKVSPHHITLCFGRYGYRQVFQIIVWWKLLCILFHSSGLLVCGSAYTQIYHIVMGLFFLLCCYDSHCNIFHQTTILNT